MRYLILSDIHANWEALEAVLDHASGRYDEILCCGDLVGYGADPNAVVDWTREHVKIVVRGNHDKASAGNEDLEWFNPVARVSAIWTLQALTPDNVAYLRNLPRGPIAVEEFQLLHGSPLDEDDYLVSPQDVSHIAGYLESTLSFFGHTHIQGGFLCHRGGVVRIPKPALTVEQQTLEFEPDVTYLVNPGSVGQPRDGDPRAGYILYAPDEGTLTYHRLPYDVGTAQAKIREAGLPPLLADRLATGS